MSKLKKNRQINEHLKTYTDCTFNIKEKQSFQNLNKLKFVKYVINVVWTIVFGPKYFYH